MVAEPMGIKGISQLLGVSSNQVYMWHQRRKTSGFPEAVANVHKPTYPGDHRKAPLFDIEDVVDWYSTYTPNKRRGAHWKEKRNEVV